MGEVHYQPLAQSPSLNRLQEPSAQLSGHWCPKLSRYKLALAIVLLLLFLCSSLLTHLLPLLWRPGPRCPHPESVLANETGRLGLHYRHTKRMLPHCIIIGARKGGTRALLQFLKLHPGVQVASREVHYFDRNDNYAQGLDWYRRHMPFAFKDQVVVEKTPGYFVSSEAPERIHRMNASIRLLLIVRDPVERTISDYAQIRDVKRQRGKVMEPFEKLALERRTGDVNVSYVAIRRSLYHRHMLKWLQFFSLEQFHLVDGSRLSTAPWEEMGAVEKFLGLEHYITHRHFVFNQTRGFYCVLNQSGLEECLASSKGRRHPEIKEAVVDKLRVFFRPYNLKFFRLVKRRFNWN